MAEICQIKPKLFRWYDGNWAISYCNGIIGSWRSLPDAYKEALKLVRERQLKLEEPMRDTCSYQS